MYLKIVILIFIIVNICFSKKITDLKSCSRRNWEEDLKKTCKIYNNVQKQNDILNICSSLNCHREYTLSNNTLTTHFKNGCINPNNIGDFKKHFKEGCNKYKHKN